MKIFGIEISKSKKVEDKTPEIDISVPKTKNITTVPRISNPVLSYNSGKVLGRGEFKQAEYDLSEIGRIKDTELYVNEAFNKKKALMFKEGWDLVGPDPVVIRYIKSRLSQIAHVSSMPTQLLFREIGSGIIEKSNAFILKVRKEESSGGKRRKLPGRKTSIDPVAAYFIIPSETMEYQLESNKIVAWQQSMPSGEKKKYSAEDIIHIYFNKKEGFVFGTPNLIPVIDDIRALRKIEENVELLVYQHLFPLFQYIVGTKDAPAGIDESGEYEVDVVRREIQYMPTEGGIVTPERHEIRAVGAEGRAIRAEGYLDHFKKRVFSGLSMSAVDFGEGDTANRATSDNMSRNLVDAVKDYQQVLEIFIDEYIIGELLLESTFGPSALDESRRCHIKFKEIDIDSQIKKEAHYADQFAKDAITWDELRTKTGYEPIAVPSREEIDSETDTGDAYYDWNRTRWKLFKEPQLLIQAVDEPFSPLAKTASRNASLSTNTSDVESGKSAKVELDKDVASVSQESTTYNLKDSILRTTVTEIKNDIFDKAKKGDDISHEWIASVIRAQMTFVIDKFVSEQMSSFKKGYIVYSNIDDTDYVYRMGLIRAKLKQRSEKYILKLTDSIIRSLRRVKEHDSVSSNVNEVIAIFDSLRSRVSGIEDVEYKKAYNFGLVSGALTKKMDLKDIKSVYNKKENQNCNICAAKAKNKLDFNSIILDDLPPYHPGCECILKVNSISDSIYISDEAFDSPKGIGISDKDYKECPKCGKTALRTKNTIDQYHCTACGHIFKEDDTDNIEEDSKK